MANGVEISGLSPITGDTTPIYGPVVCSDGTTRKVPFPAPAQCDGADDLNEFSFTVLGQPVDLSISSLQAGATFFLNVGAGANNKPMSGAGVLRIVITRVPDPLATGYADLCFFSTDGGVFARDTAPWMSGAKISYQNGVYVASRDNYDWMRPITLSDTPVNIPPAPLPSYPNLYYSVTGSRLTLCGYVDYYSTWGGIGLDDKLPSDIVARMYAMVQNYPGKRYQACAHILTALYTEWPDNSVSYPKTDPPSAGFLDVQVDAENGDYIALRLDSGSATSYRAWINASFDID